MFDPVDDSTDPHNIAWFLMGDFLSRTLYFFSNNSEIPTTPCT